MSDYVTHEEMEEFVAKAATGLTEAIETRATTTELALQLAVIAETMAFVSLRCHKDRDQVISLLESMMERQEASFLSTPMTDEEIAEHRQRLSVWIQFLRKLPS
ncbi:hypothetical protein BH20PSE1_BH20PSE1_01390 [soil metagenome]